MSVNMHAISIVVDIPICISIEDIQAATRQDADLQRLKSYIIQGWPHTKGDIEHVMQKNWPIRHGLAMIDGTVMKGKQIIIPFTLHNQILEQLHSNHMDIDKTRLLVRESVCWFNMNTDIKNIEGQCFTCKLLEVVCAAFW